MFYGVQNLVAVRNIRTFRHIGRLIQVKRDLLLLRNMCKNETIVVSNQS